MKIGLISDIHAYPAPLREALDLFREHEVETILCAGDIAGYGSELEATVDLLLESGCHCVIGNHDLWYLEDHEKEQKNSVKDFFESLQEELDFNVEGLRLSMVHASPSGSLLDGIKLLDEKGRPLQRQLAYWAKGLNECPADILVVGHTHQVFVRQLGGVLLINPGSSVFNHTCAILTLPEQDVQFYPLSGKEPVLSWNFSMFRNMTW